MHVTSGGDTAEKTGVKGGESIWGPTSFPDEFHPDNTHDKVCRYLEEFDVDM